MNSFNDHKSTSWFTIEWLDHLFAVSNARKEGGVEQYEAIACTGGGGYFTVPGGNGYGPLVTSRSENDLVANSENSNNLWNFAIPSENKNTESVSKSLGFALSGENSNYNASARQSQYVVVYEQFGWLRTQ